MPVGTSVGASVAVALADGSAEAVLDAVSDGAGPAELVACAALSTSSALRIWVIWSYPVPLPVPVASFTTFMAAAS